MSQVANVVLCAILVATTSFGQVFVSPAGNNSDGSSWANAFNSVEAGVAAANAQSKELWIANGTYAIAAAIQLYSSMVIYGGFPQASKTTLGTRDPINFPSTLDAGTNNGGIFDLESLDSVIIDGLTFDKGSVDQVEVTNSTNISFLNSMFMNATASGIYSINSQVYVANSVFDNNASDNGAGIDAVDGSFLNVIASLFTNNVASQLGGAIRTYESKLTVDRSSFADNSAAAGGGIFARETTEVVAKSFPLEPTRISSSIFVRNAAINMGGAIRLYDLDDAGVAFNTFVDNTASTVKALAGEGGGIFFSGTPTTSIINNIFDGNTQYALFQDDAIDATIKNNTFYNVDGIYSRNGVSYNNTSKGGNNINTVGINSDNTQEDPQFVNRGGDDFHLGPNSPAIDTGIIQSYGLVDFDGDARPFDVTGVGTDVTADAYDRGFDEAIYSGSEGEGEGIFEGEGEGLYEGEGEGIAEGEGEGLLEGEGEGYYEGEIVKPYCVPTFCGPYEIQNPGTKAGNALILLTALAGLLLYRSRKNA